MNRGSSLLHRLFAEADSLGFNSVGVIPAAPARRLDAYLDWINAGMHGEMGYLARPDRTRRRQDLEAVLPEVRSVICVGLSYFSGGLPEAIASDPSRGRISNYAWGLDYHDVMTPRLEQLAAWLRAAGGDCVTKVYVDTGALLERDHGESAGLGFTGKNTMLIHPRAGSWFFLGELLTTLPLVEGSPGPPPMPSCGSCTRCLRACPTAAFPRPYVLDARRCISYLTIELKGWIPAELRPLMGNWVYGCDVCQDVCPFNRFAAVTHESGFHAVDLDVAMPPLVGLLGLDEAGFSARYARGPIGRIKRRRLVRNACIAAGNWGSAAAVPALSKLLRDDEPLLRGHAAWALGRVGRREGLAAIAGVLEQERDDDVRREMAEALSAQVPRPAGSVGNWPEG